jgi:beta-lactamase class A
MRLRHLFFLLLAAAGTSRAQDTAAVAAAIRATAAEYGVRAGVMAKRLPDGPTIAVDADSLFPTASVIKLPILVALYRQFEQGALNPGQGITLRTDHARPGSGVLQYLRGGTILPLVDVATLMIILSDNTATNEVIDVLGPDHESRLEAVNAPMRALGLRHTVLLNKLYSWETKKKTDEARRFGIGVSSPADMELLLERIDGGSAAGRAACDSMLEILGRQQDVQLAARYLPFAADTTLRIANKTGSLDAVKNDVGIVRGGRGSYVYAIFCDESRTQGEETDNPATLAVARISKILYDALMTR